MNATWPLVVVAVRAERGPEIRIGLGVDPAALLGLSVAVPRRFPGRAAGAAGLAGGVDRAEAGAGQGDKVEWMLGHVLWHIFDAAGDSGVEQVPHVAVVFMGAGRADRRPAVATADVGHSIGLGCGGVGLDQPAVRRVGEG